MSILSRPVLVLNKHWTVIGTTAVKGAIILMSRGSAKGICPLSFLTYSWEEWLDSENPPSGEDTIKSTTLGIIAPSIVLLTNYGDIFHSSVKFSPRAMYRRDDYTCQYCKRQYSKKKLSIDHIVPKSKNGKTSWTNCVAACVKCNNKKADKSLKDLGVSLLKQPVKPRWNPIIHLDIKSRLKEWKPFLRRIR